MVDIIPFRGLIYNTEKIGNISEVVSPPYDVIPDEKRKELISCNDKNIVNLILPEGEGDVKYKNAAGILNEWIERQILVNDGSHCFYILEIGFKKNGTLRKLRGFIGLTKIEPYSSGNVLRHEKTMSGPKIDRYKILDSCRTNFGLIYTIYKGESKIRKILDSVSSEKPVNSFIPYYDKNLSFKFWRISDIEKIKTIKASMAEKPILIADGHHRYETSRNFKNDLQEKGAGEGPQDFVLTLYVDSSQKELEIYPTHRSVCFNSPVDLESFFSSVKDRYDSAPAAVTNGNEARHMLESFKKENIKGFIFYHNNGPYILSLKPSHPEYRSENPDIFILHEDILKKMDEQFEIMDITFDHSEDNVIKDVDSGNAVLGVFLNPPTVIDMERICYSGGLMPQKSTYFWPKPCTGLVMYRL